MKRMRPIYALLTVALVLLCWAPLMYGALYMAEAERTAEERAEAVRVGKIMVQRNGMEPGYSIIGNIRDKDGRRFFVEWHPNPFRPLGTCDDDSDCTDAVQDGCDEGCNGNGCGDGAPTDVAQDGCICSGRCADGVHWFVEICASTPGC